MVELWMDMLIRTEINNSPFQQRASIPDHKEKWEIELVSWSGLPKLFVILICDHQEKHNKDELTRGAGGRIKEVEANISTECFRETGERSITARLRAQEEIHQKASAALADKVSIIVMSGHWISLWLSSAIVVNVVLNLVASLRKSPFCY